MGTAPKPHPFWAFPATRCTANCVNTKSERRPILVHRPVLRRAYQPFLPPDAQISRCMACIRLTHGIADWTQTVPLLDCCRVDRNSRPGSYSGLGKPAARRSIALYCRLTGARRGTVLRLQAMLHLPFD